MKKKDLIAKVADEAGITHRQAEDALCAFRSAIIASAASGQSTTIRGLGTFHGKTRPARIARNPATGAAVNLPERKVLTFKATSSVSL